MPAARQGLAGGSRRPTSEDTLARGLHRVRMEGRALFRAAVRCTVDSARRALAAAGLQPEDVDFVVPHQSSRRLLAATARTLGISLERFVINLERFGNTSAGSLPIALDEAVRDCDVPDERAIERAAGFTWRECAGATAEFLRRGL